MGLIQGWGEGGLTGNNHFRVGGLVDLQDSSFMLRVDRETSIAYLN